MYCANPGSPVASPSTRTESGRATGVRELIFMRIEGVEVAANLVVTDAGMKVPAQGIVGIE